MSKITLAQVEQLPIMTTSLIELDYGDFTLKIKSKLSDFEEELFIDTITKQSFSGLDYSPMMRKAITQIMFAKLFVVSDGENGLDIPDKIDDLYATFDVVKKLDLINRSTEMDEKFESYYNSLVRLTNTQIEYNKQLNIAYITQSSANTEAIENVNEVLNKFIGLLDITNEFLSANSKKITKIITPKKIEQFVKSFQEKGMQALYDKLEKPASENSADEQLNGQTIFDIKSRGDVNV